MENNNIIELTHELGQNFIDYAMSCNLDRAIPDATTGLKPVHKRILYCALVDGNTSNKKYVKCANNVGSMLANWHPHGDSSVYSALVRLAQPWVMRYPLIDFHGNVGNQGGDPPAHYRYTECRLAKISEDGILNGVKRHAVKFQPNFDETRDEPVNLPSTFPNLLCNPNSGIGVALACSWAPHNLREVAAAINDYLDGKEPMLPGPDFPTGGLILNKDDVPKIMSTGKGSVKIRAKYNIEGNNIVFYEIPYGVTIESIIDELNALADEDKLEDVVEIRNESNKKGLRIVLECKKNASFSKTIDLVFQKTNLQSSFSYNQVALVDREPKLLNLKDCIEIYVEHNLDCIVKEHEFEYKQKKDRLEIVNGLLIALEDIDNIISLIKNSESSSHAKDNLIEKYHLSEPQAKAIVDMKLGKLAGLEKLELQAEKNSLLDEIDYIQDILDHKDIQIKILRDRLAKLVDKYGDERRTELAQIVIDKKQKEVNVVEPKDCVVTISNKNRVITRIDASKFKAQRRNTVGTKNNGNITIFSQKTNTQDTLMVFTIKGKMYRVLVDNIPEGKGIPLAALIEFEKNELPIAYTTLTRDTDKKYIFFATKNGIIKKVSLEEYDKMKRTGIISISLREGDELADITFINQEQMMLITKNGMAIRFSTTEMPISSRTAQGVKGIKLNEDDYVIACLPIEDSATHLAIVSDKGMGKLMKLEEFTVQGRSGKGIICNKTSLAGAVLVNEKDSILASGDKSSLVISCSDMPVLSRNSIGNIMVKNNEQIVSISKV